MMTDEQDGKIKVKEYVMKIMGYLLLACLCLGMIYGIRRITRLEPDVVVESERDTQIPEPEETPGMEPEETPGVETGAEEPEETPGVEHGADEPEEMPEVGPGTAESEEGQEEEQGPPRVIIASDLHLLAKELMDGGERFQERAEKDDGKTVAYSGEIIDAFLKEVLEKKPDALILSGDLTFEGEKASHQALAEKLLIVQEAGIQVLAIPGNHDINNPRASSYLGEMEEGVKTPVETVSPEEFAGIYDGFGYKQAISRDEASLSYLYPLREDIWLMMLDTNQYEPENLVEGEIRPETYQWMIGELERAKEEGVQVVPVGHHNLLQESRFYTEDCMIKSHKSAVWLFEEYKIPLYFSGHLHVQRFKKHKPEPGVPEEAYGVHEIVTSALGMSPHQYGIIDWEESGRMNYRVERVDVEAWAREEGIEDENLLDFGRYSQEWFYQVNEQQAEKKLGRYPEEYKRAMTHLYADILYRYGAGEPVKRKNVEAADGYVLWQRLLPGEKLFDVLEK